eukprot:scpid74746/ scgid28720/ 
MATTKHLKETVTAVALDAYSECSNSARSGLPNFSRARRDWKCSSARSGWQWQHNYMLSAKAVVPEATGIGSKHIARSRSVLPKWLLSTLTTAHQLHITIVIATGDTSCTALLVEIRSSESIERLRITMFRDVQWSRQPRKNATEIGYFGACTKSDVTFLGV